MTTAHSSFRDRRPVDSLSIEELERVLAIRKREARQRQLARMQRAGRVVDAPPEPANVAVPAVTTAPPASAEVALLPGTSQQPPRQHNVLQPRAGQAEAAPVDDFDFDGPLDVPQFEDGDAALVLEPERRAKADVPRYTLTARRERPGRRLVDRGLVLLEIVAVIGIVVIGANLFGAIQKLERETAEAQQLADEQRRAGVPTLVPTPTLRLENFILPTGHTIQDGAPVFNYNEVPSHLRPLVESQWIQPVASRPQPTSETALTLTIPALDISQTIVQGVDWESLKQGIGQLVNGVNPGDPVGNVVFAAHNDIYGQIFRYLDQLQPGDQFQVQTRTQNYTYTITEIRPMVLPTDVSVLESRGTATATLISCYPYQVNTHRIVVFANRVV